MSDLDDLKELLFGAEKQALDSITRRVERREVRAADVADILPEAIHQSHGKDKQLVESLSGPVGECLQRSIKQDPETYSDALYPVMGPAIRRSITHALRNFAQQVNEAVEYSVSPKGLKWRWQASRAGIPFGQYVMQKTMQYRVEQAYLISRENGLLIEHVHHEASKIKDSDAVSAMFTAIQDFVKESFSPDRSGRLESADMGEFTLWAVHGPHALMVCVIRGVPPKELRADLSAILERIHFRHGDALREYQGDTSSVGDVAVELRRCLQFEARREHDDSKGRSILWIIILVLLIAVIALFGYRTWNDAQQHKRLSEALAATPGIHVTSLERDGSELKLRGLRDPLAASMESVIEAANVDSGRVSADLQPFQSLQPEIVAARARQLLEPPPTVELEVDGATLVATGDAPLPWRQQLRDRYISLAGIEQLDDSGLLISGRSELASRVTALNNKTFLFESGTTFVPDSAIELEQYAAELTALRELAKASGYRVDASVHGSTDATGTPELNAALARQRAAVVAESLGARGVPVTVTRRQLDAARTGLGLDDARQRYARVELVLRSDP